MDASSLPPDAPLPDDVGALQRMVRELLAEIARLRAENAKLKSKLDQALKHRFGRRSERQRPQRPADDADRPAPQRDPHGRTALPAALPRREAVYDLTEAEQRCSECGQPRVCIGTQAAEQLDLEPARLFVLRTLKKTYACTHCDSAAVPPEQRLQTANITDWSVKQFRDHYAEPKNRQMGHLSLRLRHFALKCKEVCRQSNCLFF